MSLRSSMRGAGTIVCALAFVVAAACGRQATSGEIPPQSAPATPAAPAITSGDPLVVFLGDSLTAGYGLAQSDAYPARVAAMLREEGHPVRIVNAGVSGDTSAGGLRRIDWLLSQKPGVVVIALGANDGLRGLAPEETAANLRAILGRVHASSARALLVGMKLPPSYGTEYTSRFEAIFQDLAQETKVALLPFLLEGVAGDPALNLEDGIHPTAEGQAVVAATVLRSLAPLLGDR